jgi:hypothetical protein
MVARGCFLLAIDQVYHPQKNMLSARLCHTKGPWVGDIFTPLRKGERTSVDSGSKGL